jgi:hypothetical protein
VAQAILRRELASIRPRLNAKGSHLELLSLHSSLPSMNVKHPSQNLLAFLLTFNHLGVDEEAGEVGAAAVAST